MTTHTKLFGYVTIVLGILMLAYIPLVFADGASSFTYPLGEVSTVTCRQSLRETLPTECKISLPRIKNAAYQNYSSNEVYTKTYSMLRGGSYTQFDRNQLGSHPGVDIATAKGTPVYAITDATVEDAKSQAGYGNVIKLKFTSNGETLYATYAHLDSIEPGIEKGKKVTAGQKIARVGNSGNAGGGMGGNHLHFEIDVPENGALVYAFYGCTDRDMGRNEMGVVNQGLCRIELEQRTQDPIAFLEQAGATIQTTKEETTPVDVTDILTDLDTVAHDTVTVTDVADTSTTVVDTAIIAGAIAVPSSRGKGEELQTSPIETKFLATDIQDFVAAYAFAFTRYPEVGKLFIQAHTRQDSSQVYNGFLPDTLDILAAQSKVVINPVSVRMLTANTAIDISTTDTKDKSIVINFAGQRIASFTLEAIENEEKVAKFVCLYDAEERMEYFF